MQLKVKVILIGPTKSGKSVVANFLSDSHVTENTEMAYNATVGVRILEFETELGREENLEVELWDCSGDDRFEACWPAIARDALGILFLYNPDDISHSTKLDSLYGYFVDKQPNIKESQCLVIAHRKPDAGPERCRLSNKFKQIDQISSSLEGEESSEELRREFNRFIGHLSKAVSSRREQEELRLMGNQ